MLEVTPPPLLKIGLHISLRYCVHRRQEHDDPVACYAGRARLLCGVALVFGRRWELVAAHTRAAAPLGFHLMSTFTASQDVRGGARGACSIQQTAVRVAQQSLPNGSIVCKGP